MSTSSDNVERLSLPKIKPAHESLADALRKNILVGTFRPGARLPTERDIAPALGVSRNTARQAIKILADQGLVHTTLGRNGGSVVTVPAAPGRNRRASIELWRAHVVDIYAIRSGIEGLSARWAAERGTLAQRRFILKLTQQQPPDAYDYELESKLHLQIAAAAHHNSIVDMVTQCREDIFEELNVMWIRADTERLGVRGPHDDADFGTEHRVLAQAIFDQDADAAANAMHAHLRATVARLHRVLDAISVTPRGNS